MAKQTLPINFVDDILAQSMGGKRKFTITDNGDGTYSIDDVTEYTQIGSDFGASQMNQTNQAVNESCDKSDVIDNWDDIVANQSPGKIAGAKGISKLNSGFFTNTKTVSVKSDINTRIYSHSATPGTYFVTAWVSAGINEDVSLSVSMRKNQTDDAYVARGSMKDGGGVCLTKILQFSDSGTIDVYTYQKRGSNTDINCSIDVIRLC